MDQLEPEMIFVRELLIAFCRKTGRRPESVIFYRYVQKFVVLFSSFQSMKLAHQSFFYVETGQWRSIQSCAASWNRSNPEGKPAAWLPVNICFVLSSFVILGRCRCPFDGFNLSVARPVPLWRRVIYPQSLLWLSRKGIIPGYSLRFMGSVRWLIRVETFFLVSIFGICRSLVTSIRYFL